MSDLLQTVGDFIRSNPSLLIFGALAGGYALGKVKIKKFSLGSTTSVLIVAIALGATILTPDTDLHMGLIKTVAFGLFIFGIGYKVGPDFVGGVKRGGVKYVMVAVFFAVIALGTAVALSHLFGFNKGYTAGLLGGAMTQSAIIGTADGALRHLQGLPAKVEINLQSDVAVAYAMTYVFGTAGLIILLKTLASAWGIDLKSKASEARKQMGKDTDEESWESFQWSNMISPRAYKVTEEEMVGKSVGELEGENADDPDRVFPERVAIDRVKRDGQIIDDISPELVLQDNDTVLLVGFESHMFQAGKMLGEEVDDQSLREIVGEILDICMTNKDLDGQTVREVVDNHGQGCFVRHVKRQGHELPLSPDTTIHTGDVLQIMGEKSRVEHLCDTIGYPERDTNVTDLVTVGIGIIVGTLLGLIAIPIAGIPLTLGVGGGVLLSGLFFGWARSVKPTWGQIPSPALWIFIDLGLNLFIACVGIAAGPRAIAALQKAGTNIFFAGVLLTCIPHILSWLFGLYILRLNPVLLLGALTGSGTCTAALNSVRDDCESAVPVIGYTVPYALGNVLLTVWGAVIIHLV